MKSNTLLVLACLVSAPVLAQSLPDEINYGPYETRYRTLERDVSAAQTQLNQSRTSLADAKRFIAEMSAHISELQDQIADAQDEISSLRQEIPELERRISVLQSERSRIESEIRGRQSEESSLQNRHQQAVRDLRPLEELVARKEQRYREMHQELKQYERMEREADARLKRSMSEAQQTDTAMNQERNQQRKMEQELQGIESRVRSTEADIARAEAGSATLTANLAAERSKLSSLEGRVQEYQAQVASLRAAGAPAEQIQDAERKLGAATNARNNTANEIRQLESQITRNQSQIRTLRSQIDGLRRDQSALPGRIAQSEARQRQLTSERGRIQGEMNRYQSELNQAHRQVEVRAASMASLQQELSMDQMNIQRQRQNIDGIARQLESVRDEISNLSNTSRNLSSQIAQASERIRNHQARIPRLQQGISDDEDEIATGEADLARARTDERTYAQAVAKDEAKLADLTRSRDTAQSEMSRRLGLYQQYLTEAETLGASQSESGIGLGKKEGSRLSSVLSKQNGISVGKELGLAQARHWGSVRGEIQGYDLGYAEGLASIEERTRAVAEASIKAAQDAELFAQRNFKPVFFEEFVLAEFKKPMGLKFVSIKSLQSMRMSLALEEAMETVPGLSAAELARSEELISPLDASIVTAAKDVKTIEARARRLSNPEVAFEVPSKIPFGTVACTQVYKGLAVFKAACEGSYKGTFTNHYVTAAREEFSQLYQAQFESEFNSADVSQREASFPIELAAASKIGAAEGLRIGKVEIFQRTYETTYKSSYETEIVKAKEKSKGDAARELAEFLKVKPLLTVAATELRAENFRGGEEISLTGKVKNVSSVGLNGPVMIRVTEVINAQKVTGEAVLNTAAPMSLTELPILKVKVNNTARAGEKVIVRGVVELPGDLYRPLRQEKFELTQVLSANPAHELGSNFNKTPEIKGVFRRNIHFLTVSVTPKVEEIKDGYQIMLKAVGENAALIEQKETQLATGAIGVNAKKDVRFSYTFKHTAKGKSIALELSVLYAGKVLSKESITLAPR